MQKSVFFFAPFFFFVWESSSSSSSFQKSRGEKKRSPLSLLRLWSSKKKIFSEMRWTVKAQRREFFSLLSSLFTQHRLKRWQPLLWQRQRSGAKSLLQTRYAVEWLLFRLPRVLSFIVVVLHARARCKRKGERDNFLSVKFYHRSPFEREEHALEEKGLQNAFFYYEEDASRDVNDDLFVREWKAFS